MARLCDAGPAVMAYILNVRHIWLCIGKHTQSHRCVCILWSIRWDTISPMKVISAALTNEQRMADFVYSITFPCAHQSVPACVWGFCAAPSLLCYCPTYVWIQHTVFRSAWDLGEQGRSLGKCKWVEWISRSKCRLCIKLYKGDVPTKEDTPKCGYLCFKGDCLSSMCCTKG